MKETPAPELSVSVISGDPLTFVEDSKQLELGGIDSYHFDVMDGLFVPRFGLYPEYLRMLRELSDLPIDVHLMVSDPEKYINVFASGKEIRLIPHVESLGHPIRTLMNIADVGAKAGIAINPGTQISIIEPLVDFIDSVMLMAINPGIVGHKLLKNTFQRLEQLKKIIGPEREIKIILDGGVTFENALELLQAGANTIVCGAGTVFSDRSRIFDNTVKLNEMVRNPKL
jgi:ribulose-phosphate 3-epimerase